MNEAPARRRFTFSLRTLLLAASVAALVAFGLRAYLRRDGIEGSWRGTGADAKYSATFAGNSLVMRIGQGPFGESAGGVQSWFLADARRGFIDIQRDDGLQLGRFAVEGDTLTLSLADVNAPRPQDLAAKKRPRGERRYVFQRVR